MGILIAYLLGVISGVRHKNSNSHNIHPHADISNRQALPDGPVSVVCIPPARTDKERAEQKKSKRRKAIKFGAEIIGLIVLSLYTGFTYRIMRTSIDAANTADKTFKEVQKQTTLVKQQIVGTDAAVVIVNLEYEAPLPWNPTGNFKIEIHNDGKISANHLHAAYVVSRKAIPVLGTTGQEQEIFIEKGQLRPGMSNVTEQHFEVKGFQPDAILQRRETVSVEGRFTYDNGFGDIIEEATCYRLISFTQDSDCSHAATGFVSCDRFTSELPRQRFIDQKCRSKTTH